MLSYDLDNKTGDILYRPVWNQISNATSVNKICVNSKSHLNFFRAFFSFLFIKINIEMRLQKLYKNCGIDFENGIFH